MQYVFAYNFEKCNNIMSTSRPYIIVSHFVHYRHYDVWNYWFDWIVLLSGHPEIITFYMMCIVFYEITMLAYYGRPSMCRRQSIITCLCNTFLPLPAFLPYIHPRPYHPLPPISARTRPLPTPYPPLTRPPLPAPAPLTHPSFIHQLPYPRFPLPRHPPRLPLPPLTH